MLKLLLRNIQNTRTNRLNLINRNKLNIHIGVTSMSKEVKIDKEELRKRLTPVQYHVTQEKGTERPFSGCYNRTNDEGLYVCVVCEEPLFSSNTKYESSCGWPAFHDVLEQGKVKLSPDTSGGIYIFRISCFLRWFKTLKQKSDNYKCDTIIRISESKLMYFSCKYILLLDDK